MTADMLVEWDRTHGRKLFTWDNEDAAEEYRKHEARLFLNRFRARFDGLRVRAFIHCDEDEAQGIADGYYSVETISAHPGMRDQILADITTRMASLAAELKMWQLTNVEQQALFARLAEAMA